MTRRQLLSLAAGPLFGQGVSTRGVRALPRGKPSGLPFGACFTDVAAKAGLTAPVIYGGVDKKDYIFETVGCGVAFFDYDNDGWLDIFVLSGTRVDGAPKIATNRLYKNNRDGTFKDVTAAAGLTRTGWASSVTAGDYNNDGFEDLFITYYGQNVLYRNNGDGTFTDVTRRAGLLGSIPASEWSSGCTFVDYDRDGRLDLFVASYLDLDPKALPKPGTDLNCNWKGVPVNCGPRGLKAGRAHLFHNNGDGTFSNVSNSSGIAAASGSYCMTAVAADFDNDGWPDIYVACDSTPSFLFRNNHDGNIDIFKTHFADDTNVLYRNDGKGVFEDVTIRSGLAVETRYIAWGAGMVDLDNDGWPDLFVVTGSVYPEDRKSVV